MHSKTASKNLLGLWSVVAVRFGQRQILMFLVDGARSFRRAYDLARGTERSCRLYDTVNAQMTRPILVLRASGARYSLGERLLV
jgi:hypothetical protein